MSSSGTDNLWSKTASALNSQVYRPLTQFNVAPYARPHMLIP